MDVDEKQEGNDTTLLLKNIKNYNYEVNDDDLQYNLLYCKYYPTSHEHKDL